MYKTTTGKIPKVIPPRSRVRLLRADNKTPHWQQQVGRQFRIGYYSRKDGLDCIWLVNEGGAYEQTTDRASLLKYFQIERLSSESDFYGSRKRRLRKIRIQSLFARLNGRSEIDVFQAAKEMWERNDAETLRSVVSTLRDGKRVMNRTAAAYALNLMRGNAAIPALEDTLNARREHPRVRGQAAESLAHSHREKSHGVLLKNLGDSSKEVRFWCAYALAEMGDCDALTHLAKLVAKDRRIVKGLWSVSREAKWAIRKIQGEIQRRAKRRSTRCLYCSKVWG
jgi:HEAT repeats